MEKSNQTLLIIVCSPRPPLLMRKELYVLNLISNRFNSSILASLGALKSLQTLVMGDNEITSIFPKGKLFNIYYFLFYLLSQLKKPFLITLMIRDREVEILGNIVYDTWTLEVRIRGHIYMGAWQEGLLLGVDITCASCKSITGRGFGKKLLQRKKKKLKMMMIWMGSRLIMKMMPRGLTFGDEADSIRLQKLVSFSSLEMTFVIYSFGSI